MANKSTQAQLSERVRIVFELLLSGTPRVDIIQYSSKNWGVTDRMCDKYIAKANEIIKAESVKIIENIFEDHLVVRDAMRLQALKDGDKRFAFEILRDTDKLVGLYAPKKMQVGWSETLPNDVAQSDAVKQFKEVMDEARSKAKVEE